jgi:hypothetical protein
MTWCVIHPQHALDDVDGNCDECRIEKNKQLIPSVKCQRCTGPVQRLSVASGDASPYMHRWDLYCQKKCSPHPLGWIEFDDSEPAFEHVQQVLDGYTINMRGSRLEGLVHPREGEFANWKAILRKRVEDAFKNRNACVELRDAEREGYARYLEAKACFEALFEPDGTGEIP